MIAKTQKILRTNFANLFCWAKFLVAVESVVVAPSKIDHLLFNYYSCLSPPPCQVEEQETTTSIEAGKGSVRFKLPSSKSKARATRVRWSDIIEPKPTGWHSRKLARHNTARYLGRT